MRFSTVDLSDGPGTDELHNATFGATWILNPHTRILFNYIHSEVEGPVDGDAHIGVVRFQFDF